MSNYCPLCNNTSNIFYKYKKRLYHQCENCYGIFVDKTLLPKIEEEKLRYKEHNNDVNNKQYQNFVLPITSAIIRDFNTSSIGLDFGAGTGPVISKILKDNSFKIVQYDPLFYNFPKLLNKRYNYIACCEVIEHFHNPHKEFGLLKDLLLPSGKLYCMTYLYNESIDFHSWNYKNDKTHVFIYHKKTIEWINKEFNFLNVFVEDRLLIFST